VECELQHVHDRERSRQARPAREEARGCAAAAAARLGKPLHRLALAFDLASYESLPADGQIHLVLDASEVDRDPVGPPRPPHRDPRTASPFTIIPPPGALNLTCSPRRRPRSALPSGLSADSWSGRPSASSDTRTNSSSS